jgi:hypothetical protein
MLDGAWEKLTACNAIRELFATDAIAPRSLPPPPRGAPSLTIVSVAPLIAGPIRAALHGEDGNNRR